MKIKYKDLRVGEEFLLNNTKCMLTNDDKHEYGYAKYVVIDGPTKGCVENATGNTVVEVSRPLLFENLEIGEHFSYNGGVFYKTENIYLERRMGHVCNAVVIKEVNGGGSSKGQVTQFPLKTEVEKYESN